MNTEIILFMCVFYSHCLFLFACVLYSYHLQLSLIFLLERLIYDYFIYYCTVY